MADMKHPKDLFEPISRHDSSKESNYRCTAGLPIIFNFRDMNKSHVEDHSKET